MLIGNQYLDNISITVLQITNNHLKNLFVKKVCLIICGFCAAVWSFGQAGNTDGSFGSNGIATTSFGPIQAHGRSMVIQSDGKIIMAGYRSNGALNEFAISRYNTDGTADFSFDTDGKNTATFGISTENEAYAVALQNDGKAVVGGYTHSGSKDIFAIARFNTDGSIDNSFGSGGKIVTPVRNDKDYIRALAIQTDGKIIAGGSSFGATGDDFALVRYNTDGSVDESFGESGKLIHVIGKEANDIIHTIIIQPDNKILVAGTKKSTSQLNLVLARYNSNGSVDTEFGTNGISLLAAEGEAYSAATLLSDGKIILTGSNGNAFMIARFLGNGMPDLSFGKDGKAFNSFGATSQSTAILTQPDGKIVVGGYTDAGITWDMAIARFLPGGLPDNDFGIEGRRTLNVNGNDFVYTMQRSGQRIYLGGVSNQVVFSVVAFQTGSIILPLHLLSFTATAKNTTTELHWQTSFEKNTALFEIQRGNLPETYKPIANINSAGNSTALLYYSFIDEQPLAGTNFYRLKMVDKDGRYTFSKTIIVQSVAVKSFKIYPNPAQHTLHILIPPIKNQQYRWSIKNMNGKKVMTGKGYSGNAVSIVTQNIRSLTNGTYSISIENGESIESHLFIKQ